MSLKFKLISATFIILTLIVILVRPYYLFFTQTIKISPLKTLFSVDGPKTYDNRVNILVLGIAGANHDGPNLSDSMVIISYDLKTNRIFTISIPRDIWSPTLRDKINSAYAYGEAKKPGGGFILAKTEVEAIIGQPIQYAVAINFDQFEEMINYLGGIDVNVENSFVDKEFPITGKENDLCNGDPLYKCRYETISFSKGLSHMDGQTALNFVRSRHAIGSEGTDFAREKRQQKVIEAVKNKLVIVAKKFDLNVYKKLYNLADNLIKRDINNQQVAILFRDIVLKGNLKQDKIVLSDDFFVNPVIDLEKYDNLWVLIPKNNDIKTVQDYISCRLSEKTTCERLK